MTNDQKGRSDEVDSEFNSWHFNNLFNAPKPRSSTTKALMGSPDERVFQPNFLSSSTPLPHAHIQNPTMETPKTNVKIRAG